MALDRRAFALALMSGAVMTGPALSQTDDQAALEKAVAAFYRAYLDADGEALKILLADTMTFGHSDGRVEDKTQTISGLLSKKTIFKRFAMAPGSEMFLVQGPIGVVRHRVAIDSENAERKASTTNVAILQVWQKHEIGWRLLARQAARL